MLEENISGAPVVDAEGHLVGVLSESDIIWKVGMWCKASKCCLMHQAWMHRAWVHQAWIYDCNLCSRRSLQGAGVPEDHYVVPPVYIGLVDTVFFLRDNKQTEQVGRRVQAGARGG